MARNNDNIKKSRAEVNTYRQFLKESAAALEGTVNEFDSSYNNHLEGSDQPAKSNDKSEDGIILDKPFKLKAQDFLKEKWIYLVFAIIAGILIFLFTSSISTIISNNRDIGVIYEKINTIQKNIDSIDKKYTNYLDKDYFTKELDNLKNSIDSGQAIKLKDIENRVNLIENNFNKDLENIKNRLNNK